MIKTGKGIGAFLCGEKAEESETSNSTVEAVLFSKQDYLVTGTLEGNVTVWDMSTQVRREVFPVIVQVNAVIDRFRCRGSRSPSARASPRWLGEMAPRRSCSWPLWTVW
jgi:hypothetical protein